MVDNRFSATNVIAALGRRDDTIIHEALTAWMEGPIQVLKGVATEFIQNDELAAAVEKCLNAPKAGQVDDAICRWLYQWYQIDCVETRRFVLKFIPQLIWMYLHNSTNNDVPPGVEACLLCIYNQEVANRRDMEISFHPPTLSIPSYLSKSHADAAPTHTLPTQGSHGLLAPPASSAPGLALPIVPISNTNMSAGLSALTENALRLFNKQVKSITIEKPLKPIDLVTIANRDAIVRIALQRFNENISLFPPRVWVAFCKMCKRLANFGFDFTITPIPLLKSKSFAAKYTDDDLDNLVIDSDEDLDDFEDEYGVELSDSDIELRPRDVDKGDFSPDESPIRRKIRSPGRSASGTPNTPRRRAQKLALDANISSSSSSSVKAPPLPVPSSPSSQLPIINTSIPSSTSPSSSPSPASALSLAVTSPTISSTPFNQIEDHNNNDTSVNNLQGEEHGGEQEEETKTTNGDESNSKIPAKPPVRIILTAPCLQEMVTGLTFCIFKDSYKEEALKALRKIHLRASYDLIPEIILSSNALLHLEFVERQKSVQTSKSNPRVVV